MVLGLISRAGLALWRNKKRPIQINSQRPARWKPTLETLEGRDLPSGKPLAQVLLPPETAEVEAVVNSIVAEIRQNGYPVPPQTIPAMPGGSGPSATPVIVPVQGSSLAGVPMLVVFTTSTSGPGPSQTPPTVSGSPAPVTVAALPPSPINTSGKH